MNKLKVGDRVHVKAQPHITGKIAGKPIRDHASVELALGVQTIYPLSALELNPGKSLQEQTQFALDTFLQLGHQERLPVVKITVNIDDTEVTAGLPYWIGYLQHKLSTMDE